MKKKVMLVLLLGLTLIGCSSSSKAQATSDEVFEVTSSQKLEGYTGDLNDKIFMIKHNSTGRRFILYKGSDRCALVPFD